LPSWLNAQYGIGRMGDRVQYLSDGFADPAPTEHATIVLLSFASAALAVGSVVFLFVYCNVTLGLWSD